MTRVTVPRCVFTSAAITLLLANALYAQAPYPRISANDNRVRAGVLKDGILTIKLDIVRGMFHPDADTDPGADLLAFAEVGHAPSIPGPLIRAPLGTEIHITVRNALTDSSIFVTGLSGARTAADTVRLQPGESRELVTKPAAAGTFLYAAGTARRSDPSGDDRMLVGAFIIDQPGYVRPDRVIVLLQWLDTIRLKNPEFVNEVNTLNGKVYPFTEHFDYNLGDTITWRVINGSVGTHPMHLHGAYFNVLSRGTTYRDTVYTPEQQRLVVTERMTSRTTMTLQWTPQRAGNWLFHCHLTFHAMPHPPLGPMKASSDHPEHDGHGMHAMGGLVIGTTIHGRIAPDVKPRRTIRLVINQYDSIPGELGPPFSFALDDAKKMTIPGPPIVVSQNEPIAITVVNRAKEPTSVHWHGLEIESYYDGVAGFGGTPARVTPVVAANDSFVVKMTPPRAGTFIYHSHANDVRQQGGGLHAAFIVLPPGTKWNPERERIIIIETPRDTTAIHINGQVSPIVEFTAGVEYRIRFINITLANPSISMTLTDGTKVQEWHPVARDGADLPAHQSAIVPASMPITIGETDDVLYTPSHAGEYRLEIKAGSGILLGAARLVVH